MSQYHVQDWKWEEKYSENLKIFCVIGIPIYFVYLYTAYVQDLYDKTLP